MKTALLTGSTPMQVGSHRTQLGIVTAAAGWAAALEDMGYRVDWRPVTPGEDLSSYDVAIAIPNQSNALVANYFYGALWTLITRPDAIIALDDWQIGQIMAGAQTMSRSWERAFRLQRFAHDAVLANADVLFAALPRLGWNWEWTSIAPVLGNGDVSLLGVPGPVVGIDPTAYVKRYPAVKAEKRRVWVQASLLAKPLPVAPKWPVEEFGPQDKAKGGGGTPGANARPRVPESELMAVYCASWGILSPAHPHAGSGWWRVRYLMSADAGCVLSADAREAYCLGDPYLLASDIRLVERLDNSALKKLAFAQRDRFNEIVWPKERVKDTLSDVIKSVRRRTVPKVKAARVEATQRKALLTGCTAIQVGSPKTDLKIVTAASAWKAALEDLGYEVEWRPVVPGEDVSGYEVVFVAINKPNSIASRYVYGAVWTLAQRQDAIVVLDDWQVGYLKIGFEHYAANKDQAFKFERSYVDETNALRDELHQAVCDIARQPWPWPVIAPVLGKPDIAKLNLPYDVIPMDPTAYAFRYPRADVKRSKSWVQASLLDKPLPLNLSWPVLEFGPQNREKVSGGGSRPGENAKPRVPEPELMNVYCGSWGVLSPAHPHAGSGWWRVRYLMSADAGCVLSADPKEAACLGQPYLEASDPRRVEKLSDASLADLAARQAKCLADVSWPKQKVKDSLLELIRKVRRKPQMPKFSQPAGKVAVPAPTKTAVRPPTTPQLVDVIPGKQEGEGSGAYIRRMIRAGHNDTDALLAAVHANFPGSKAKASDINWNRNKIKQEDAGGGAPAPRVVNRPSMRTIPAAPVAAQPDLPWEETKVRERMTAPAPSKPQTLAKDALAAAVSAVGMTVVNRVDAADGTTVLVLRKA